MKLMVFIFINVIAIGLLFVRSKRHINFWYAGYLFSFSLGLFVATIDPNPNITVANHIFFRELIARFLSALSFRLSPWFFLCAYISMSNFFKHKKSLYYFLLIPAILSFAYDFLYPKYSFLYVYLDYSPQFWVLSLWVIPYVLTANYLIIYEVIKERHPLQKLQKFAIMILTLPSTYIIYQAYIMPLRVHSRHDFTAITTVFGLFVTILFVFFATRFGILGIKIDYHISNETEELLSNYNLTESEKAIIYDTLDGLTVNQIAEKRSMAVQTIKNYRNSIYKKVNVKDYKDLTEKFKLK